MEAVIEILPAKKEAQFPNATRPEITPTENQSSTLAYNKGWQRFLPLYDSNDVGFSDRVRLAKIHSLIDATLESNEIRWDLKWILLEYCQVSVDHRQGGAIKKCPFIKQRVFCRGLLAHLSLSLALLKARTRIAHDCYLIITDYRKFRACITITKPKCL